MIAIDWMESSMPAAAWPVPILKAEVRIFVQRPAQRTNNRTGERWCRRNKRGGSLTNIAPPKVRHVAIIAVPTARMLDVVGPAEVFADANKLHGGEPIHEVEIIAASENRAVPSQIGVPILANGTKTLLFSNLLRAH
jgi:hypothetical protein